MARHVSRSPSGLISTFADLRLSDCFVGTKFHVPIFHVMQESHSRSASLKQAEEEEGLLKTGEAGSSTFIPLETDLTAQQRAAFRYIDRSRHP